LAIDPTPRHQRIGDHGLYVTRDLSELSESHDLNSGCSVGDGSTAPPDGRLSLPNPGPQQYYQISQLTKNSWDITRHVRIIPSPFNEREADEYILHFEKVSLSLGWLKESLTMLLQCVSGGKTQDIYSALAIDLCSQDDEVKWAILKTYELVPET